jgi:hypothetical protein
MPLQFFGFTLDRVKPGQDRDLLRQKNQEEQPASFVPPTSDDGSTAIAAGGYYGQYLDLEGDAAKTDVDLIRKYRISAEQPECDMAIEDIVNESIIHEEHEAPVDINLDDLEQPNSIKKEIKAEFDRVCQLLNFNLNGQDIFRRWYVDGRLYFHIIVDEENRDEGILELRAVDALRIRKVREIKEETDSVTGAKIIKTLDEYYLYQDGGLQKSDVGLKINKDAVCYVPSGILDASRKRVLSPLHKALKPVNQLRMMEDALVIYRLSRAPERRIFYIDVGNLPKGKAEEYMRHIMNQYRNKLVYDAVTGEIRDDRKHMSMLEDFWLPRREGGRGTEISTLPGGENLSQIDDIIFFQKKLYRSLNVPISRLEPDTGFNLGKSSEITRDEVKFQKFVNKLRKKFSALFFELLRVQLILKGVITEEDWAELKESIRFDFRKDNFFSEMKDAEILSGRIDQLNAITPFIGTYFSQNWVKRHVLKMTDEDIEEMQEEIELDAEMAAEQALQNPQQDTGSGIEDISGNEQFDRSA